MKTARLMISGVVWTGVIWISSAARLCAQTGDVTPDAASMHHHNKHSAANAAQPGAFPAGTPMVWEDRGELTPVMVYWGVASRYPDPMSRLPSPPFSQYKKDTTPNAISPKAKLTDSKGVKWTAKLGEEAHADTVAPRLAWALGFGAVEGYYVESGKIEGVNAETDLGRARGAIKPDGSFTGGARFKRHNKNDEPIKNAQGEDMTWDEGQNPGVPPEQLSGLLIFDVMVSNWDAQPKNCKIYHVDGPHGPENWYIVSDMGASFADRPKHKFILADYASEPGFIKKVDGDTVGLNFADANRAAGAVHTRIPLRHAQWFRKQLAKLTDAEVQAAFDAAFATDALNRAYVSGDAAQIKRTRERELSAATREEIAGFVAKFRARIDEFMQKIPAGS